MTILRAATFLAIGLAAVASAQPQPIAKQSIDEALIIGTTTLRLGMSKASVVPALELQYDVTTTPDGGWYRLQAKAAYIGDLYFDTQGRLVGAVKRWTPEPRHYSDGEIGRALVALIGALVNEGRTACSVDTLGTFSAERTDTHSAAPRVVDRTAMIKCGHKQISIEVMTQPDGTDGIDITEAIQLHT
jgi:hypothetical protein